MAAEVEETAVEDAVAKLKDAIGAFRKACGKDPDCKAIVAACDRVESAIEQAYPDEEAEEQPGAPDEPEQPTNLKDAEKAGRAWFAARRASSNTRPVAGGK